MKDLRNRIEKGFEVFTGTIYRHRIKTLLAMGILFRSIRARGIRSTWPEPRR